MDDKIHTSSVTQFWPYCVPANQRGASQQEPGQHRAASDLARRERGCRAQESDLPGGSLKAATAGNARATNCGTSMLMVKAEL